MGQVQYGKIIENAVRLPLNNQLLGSPALGGSATIHAPVPDTGVAQTITTAITNPDVPRNITATPSGTAANVTAVSVTITGTDGSGAILSETLPPFVAGALTPVSGLRAFKTVTSIGQPVIGIGVSVAYGTGARLGLGQTMNRDATRAAYLNSVRESIAPTVTFDNVNLSNNTAQLASALNGTPVTFDIQP